MKTLLVLYPQKDRDDESLSSLADSCGAESLRLDLAWQLFLSKEGFTPSGMLDIPFGNPRKKWFGLNQWLRQTLGGFVDGMSKSDKRLVALLPSCTAAAQEYVRRTLSTYSCAVGVLDLHNSHFSPEEAHIAAEHFFQADVSFPEGVENGWIAPVVNVDAPATPLLSKSSKEQDGGRFTWLAGLMGSDRLFPQFYHLSPNRSGNRYHSHSDVDELYFVTSGSGTLATPQGPVPLNQGDVVFKPAGSGLALQFIAGGEGISVLDIEAWTRSDQTDVVVYPQHGEALLRGRGLNHAVPEEGLFPGDELMKDYAKVYRRNRWGNKE